MAFTSRSYEAPRAASQSRRYGRGGVLDFRDRDSQRKPRTKQAPPDQTNAENFYYLKQMNQRTPMVIVMTDGEHIRGCIEWYDRSSIKVNRDGAPNLVIQKQWIKYLFKEEELQTRGNKR